MTPPDTPGIAAEYRRLALDAIRFAESGSYSPADWQNIEALHERLRALDSALNSALDSTPNSATGLATVSIDDMRVTHPQLGKTKRPNFVRVDLPRRLTVWFSYGDAIAFTAGTRIYTRENVWSSTMGRHIAYLAPQRQDQLPPDAFSALFAQIWKRVYASET